MHAGWGLCNKCFGHLEQENKHALLDVFKLKSSCFFPGCFGVPKKDTTMCSGCSHHENILTVTNWNKDEVDTLVEYRMQFEEFRKTATREQVYDELRMNYANAVRKIKQGGTPSLKNKRTRRDSDEATGSETAKKQRTAIDPQAMRQVMDVLAGMSPPQLLQINIEVAHLLDCIIRGSTPSR